MGTSLVDFPRSPRRHGGFSLIELLIVISIVAILAALLFPLMGLVRSRADSAQCLAQLNQIGPAMGAYMNDHDGLVPGPLSFKQSATYVPTQAGSLAALLATYLEASNPTPADGVSRFSRVFECPAAGRRLKNQTTATYCMNLLPLPASGQSVWGDVTLGEQPLSKSAMVNWNQADDAGAPLALSEIWMIQDADQYYALNILNHSNFSTGPVDDLLPTPAHDDHFNCLYLDFHVASKKGPMVISEAKTTPAPGGPAGAPNGP